MEKNPWKTLKSKSVYENPWISVQHNEVINPGGGKGIYGKVHFKNVAVGIIPIDEENNTWLVGQYRYTLNEYSWEIPEGGSPMNTDPLDSAKRELKEETGIVAQEWKLLSKLHTSNSVTDELGFIYLAKGLHFTESEAEECEDLKIKKLPLSEAIEMAMDGRITDSLSLIGLLKVGRLVRLKS